MCQCGYFKKVYQITIHGANKCLNKARFIYSKLFFFHLVFSFWGLWFCFAYCFRFLSEFLFNILGYTSLRPGTVGDSILDLFVFPFGDSVFLFGIFFSQSRFTLGYHFPFWLCVFLCGVSGLCFRVLFFVFVSFGHHIYVLWGKHVIELS